MEENYGAKTTLQSPSLIDKVKKTKKKKYNNEYYTNKEKQKTTKKKKYGDENYNNREKSKKTMKRKYGYEHALQNINSRNRFKKTCKEKYGVEYPMQNKNSFEKQQQSGFNAKKFKNTNIYYRGQYEFDFLDKYYDLFSDMNNASRIKYIFENKVRYYFPDFYIPSLNLIVEIKNSYLAKKDKEKIEAKEKATISNGFRYIMIIDKDYSNFLIKV